MILHCVPLPCSPFLRRRSCFCGLRPLVRQHCRVLNSAASPAIGALRWCFLIRAAHPDAFGSKFPIRGTSARMGKLGRLTVCMSPQWGDEERNVCCGEVLHCNIRAGNWGSPFGQHHDHGGLGLRLEVLCVLVVAAGWAFLPH